MAKLILLIDDDVLGASGFAFECIYKIRVMYT